MPIEKKISDITLQPTPLPAALVEIEQDGESFSAEIQSLVPDADETNKGKAKVTSQTDIEDAATTNDADFVTAKKFWLGWTKIKTLAQTISGIWTFSKEIILSPITEPGTVTNKLYSIAGNILRWHGKTVVTNEFADDIKITDASKGIILRSQADNSYWRITINTVDGEEGIIQATKL